LFPFLFPGDLEFDSHGKLRYCLTHEPVYAMLYYLSTDRLMKEPVKANIEIFGRKVEQARKGRGVREVAREIGISHATLSRVERGFMPDLETFGKICRWLKVDPAEILGVTDLMPQRPAVAVHFRKDQAIKPATARALANMILAAQRAMFIEHEEEAIPHA
jgi:transcriptional regulator with XRE-family HTH domain